VTNTQNGALPPAGWYPDPNDPSMWRWWDGMVWTEHFAPRQAQPPTPDPQAQTAVVATRAQDTLSVFKPAKGRPWKRQQVEIPSLADVVSQLQVSDLGHPLDEQIEVAGETYYVKGIKRVFMEHSMPITARGNTLEEVQCAVVPERWNPHDPNAVAVMIGMHHVGHIPADLACDYSPPLLTLAARGYLAAGVARVWAKDEGGMVRARVTVCLPEAHVL